MFFQMLSWRTHLKCPTVGACLSTTHYLKTWCVWVLTPRLHISLCLSLKWMAFCQYGLALSAAVSTVKSEGQRGDVSIDTLLEITLSPPEIPRCWSNTRQGDDCEFLAEGRGMPLKRQMWLIFSENALFLVIVSEVGLKGCDTEITLPPGV